MASRASSETIGLISGPPSLVCSAMKSSTVSFVLRVSILAKSDCSVYFATKTLTLTVLLGFAPVLLVKPFL